ncbi:MAG: DegT/DnrJ/EryC1/StrS family aminotransferase [Christensenella sp.]
MEFRDLKAQYRALKDEIDEAVHNVLVSGKYIMGPQVKELENQLADYVGVKHCISCANGTDALQLALMAWDISAGDAVFVADFTFFASAEVISAVGAHPIFVDVDANTFNMDAQDLECAIKRVIEEGKYAPKAVIAVNLFGLPADYEKIRAVCEKYNLKLLEDAAQGFGGRIGEQRACSFGDISTTSFFTAKPLCCYGDGGAIFTDNDEWSQLLRSYSVQGKGTEKYDNVRIGMNSRLDTIQAAILLIKLKAFDTYELKDVTEAAALYTQLLSDIPVIKPFIPQGYFSSWAQYSIMLKNEAERNGLKKYLEEQGIPSMIYYPKPMHVQTAFFETEQQNVCAAATDICKRILSLPLSPYIKKADIESVCEKVKGYMEK